MKISNRSAAAVLALAASFGMTAYVQATIVAEQSGMNTQNVSTTEMTDGEVRKIDMDTLKITLKHGDIKNLGMPAMTMVFKVKDAAMLDTLQVGSKVRFTAQKSEGSLLVTAIEVAS